MTHYYSQMTQPQRRAVREEMAKQQGGNCWYCKQPLTGKPLPKIENYPYNMRLFPPSMFKYPVHLHHDHDTDICLGAVHAKCNAYMWETEHK